MRFWERATGRPLGTLLPLHEDQSLAVSAAGHLQASQGRLIRDVVYITFTAEGQKTYTPDEFTKAFGWKNDPSKVRFDGK